MKVSSVSVFITRKCSQRCWHCSIWKVNMKELPPEKWIDVFRLFRDEWNPHITIMGGEPLEYYEGFESLLKLVKLLEKEDIPYAIISNSLKLSELRAKKLAEAGLLNWSVSVDYPSYYGDLRSLAGFKALKWFKKYGVPDLLGLVTVYPQNIPYLKDVIKELVDLDVWIELSYCMWAKNKYYDSFPGKKPNYSLEELELLREVIEFLDDLRSFGAKIHASKNFFKWEVVEMMLNADFRCEQLLIPMIDSDGSLRLCRDIAGMRVRKFTAYDLVERSDVVHSNWLLDYREMCEGCNWGCAYFVTDGFTEEFKHGFRVKRR